MDEVLAFWDYLACVSYTSFSKELDFEMVKGGG